MSADADFRSIVQRRLWRAVLLRRAPLWAATLLPLLLLFALAVLRGAPAVVARNGGVPPGPGAAFLLPLILLTAWLLWLALDVRSLRRRVGAEWPRWLDAAVPAMEDLSLIHI